MRRQEPSPLADPRALAIWCRAALRTGHQVVRTDAAYASSDGRGTIFIGVDADLDVDDAAAQLVFHELCHAVTEGRPALIVPDWGLDNVTARDAVREHGCLRFAAALADRHGLREALAPTTEYRPYYDALAADPLAAGAPAHAPAAGPLAAGAPAAGPLGPGAPAAGPLAAGAPAAGPLAAGAPAAGPLAAGAPAAGPLAAGAPAAGALAAGAQGHGPVVDPAVAVARRALLHLAEIGWADILEEALRETAAFLRDGRGGLVGSRVPGPGAAPHPVALGVGFGPAGETCSGCAWMYLGGRGPAVARCRQTAIRDGQGTRTLPATAACALWEKPVDCQVCGACCREAYHSVTVAVRDPVVWQHPELIVRTGHRFEILRDGPRCAALRGEGQAEPYCCVIYADRPRPCRDFAANGRHCLDARRRVGLSARPGPASQLARPDDTRRVT